jgi:type II secretory ATPase GspE/PulE/Tfp pilus assembly ATPase PilB-like protein
MRISSEVRSQIARGHDLMAIREAARKAGMRTLREDGLAKVGLGITSMEEVVRATEIEM